MKAGGVVGPDDACPSRVAFFRFMASELPVVTTNV